MSSMESLNAAVATVLNVERTALGLTLADLAEATGIKYESLQRYLAGKRVMNTAQVKALADALFLTPDEVYEAAEARVARDQEVTQRRDEGWRAHG